MLYNKLYIRAMALILLLLVIAEACIAYFTVRRIQLELITTQKATTLLLITGIIAVVLASSTVGLFVVNSFRNDLFIVRKAAKEQETYLLNEKALHHKISQVIELYNNYGIVHSMLVIDVIFRGGNKVLYEVVNQIENIIRKNDLVFRMNNGNFVIVANCNLHDAISLGEKIIEKLNSLGKDIDSDIAISIGVTHTKKNDTKNSMISRTDKSVFAAIKYGRNRVEHMS